MAEGDRFGLPRGERAGGCRRWRWNGALENVLTAGGFFVLVVLLQWLSGAYASELAHEPDEPAHVVTSLMFGDYVRSGLQESPFSYAQKYYVRYPKVAVGMWPPVFYSVAGAWTLAFGATQGSLLALAAVLGALLSTSLTVFVRRLYGRALGLTAGVSLTLLRPVQWSNAMVMLDIAVALACFWSMWLLVEYFKSERLGTAIAFGAVTAAAMLVKGNAIACVLMVVFLLPLTGRYRLLMRPGLYAAGVVVAAVGLPWQIASLKMLQRSVPMAHVDVHYFSAMMTGYVRILAREFTPAVGALLLVGLGVAAWPALRRTPPGSLGLAGAASLFLATLVFHCVTPNPGPDERYMTAALAPGMALFVSGCRHLSRLRFFAAVGEKAGTALLTAVSLVAAWGFGAFAVPRLPVFGFKAAARMAMASNTPGNTMLVFSDSKGEGGIIAEVALRDRRLSRIVLRASKVIEQRPWSGEGGKIRFENGDDLARYLEAVATDVVVVDLSASEQGPARTILLAALQQRPGEWSAAGVEGAYARKLAVYTRADRSHLVPGPIRISLPYTLGRDLELPAR
jgi:hypothetical protein